MTEGRGASPASTSGPLNGEISLFGLSRLLVVRARANSTDGTEQEGRKVVALEREFKDPLWQALIASWPTLTQDERRAVSGVARGLAELHGRAAQALTVIDGGAAMPPRPAAAHGPRHGRLRGRRPKRGRGGRASRAGTLTRAEGAARAVRTPQGLDCMDWFLSIRKKGAMPTGAPPGAGEGVPPPPQAAGGTARLTAPQNRAGRAFRRAAVRQCGGFAPTRRRRWTSHRAGHGRKGPRW